MNNLGVLIITQSDAGTENYGVANAHTTIRHLLDEDLANTLQHRFMPGHNNILSEVKWSIFWWDFVPGFEDILQNGVNNGWYDVNDVLEKWVYSSLNLNFVNIILQSPLSLDCNTLAAGRNQQMGEFQE